MSPLNHSRMIEFRQAGQPHDGLAGTFTVLDIEATQSIGYVEYSVGGVYVSDYHAVAGYLYRKDRFQADALGAAESTEVIAPGRAAMD